MMQLNNEYQREHFLNFLEEDFIPDFKKDVRPVNIGGFSSIKKASYLGESKKLDLQVFEFLFEGSPNKRVALTKDAFSVMRSSAIFQALAVFHSPDSKDWRFSLMTATPEPTEKGKVSVSYSNPKRLSFFLGPNAKINTPTKFLISKGKVSDFEDLKNRFSIEVVNKEFYKEISRAFSSLVSGLLKLPDTLQESQRNLEFAVRLIGRIIFCWFLREKKSKAGLSLMPRELLSLEAVKKKEDYYHKILEPIFFEVLNKQVKSRIDDFTKKPFSFAPYLNGGLFSPEDDDFYERNNGDFQSQYNNTLVIPDKWFKKFFEILETYNFTIDENTSYDEELSIDPEMLGRIFENLLAEINPETGESARKSTGSYYTPRVIVNYMVDESLLLYLKEQTKINEEKLRAVITYDLSDDSENSLSPVEKEKIIDALEKVKILDPACGSGAFPIGALQKIVFILQQIDPEGQLWFKKQIKNTSPEIRRVFEREFSHKNFDYIRKLGIIRENIYGVDIQPIATEISRLRCFLTLIVDESIQDEAENRGIEPLPNLDFKFVTANTLIGLPKMKADNEDSQIEMFDDYEKINKLKSARDSYFTSSGIEREQLKSEFRKIQKDLVYQMVQEHGFVSLFKAELTNKLTEWDPFSHKSSSWFDPEWMFGMKEGFDIIIANPPYVSNKKMHKEKMQENIKEFKNIYLAMKGGNCDLYILFIENGLNLVKDSGIVKFIIPNKFLIAKYSKALLSYLIQYQYLTSIDDFSRTSVFEGVSVYPIVIELIKTSNKAIRRREFEIDNVKMKMIEEQIMPYKNLTLETLSPSKKEQPLIDKIFIQSVVLGDVVKVMPGINGFQFTNYGRCIFDGVPTGKENLPKKRVVITGSIDRYFVKNDPIKYNKRKLRNPTIIYDPSVISPGKWHLFETPKIIIAGMAKKIEAYFDENGDFACGVNVYSVFESQNLKFKYILAYLNSKLCSWLFKTLFYDKHLSGDYISINATLIRKIPIKNIDCVTQNKFIQITDKIIKKKYKDDIDTSDLEKQIDQLVYKLYDLTPEEIEVVEHKN